jgi:hypothetical protein
MLKRVLPILLVASAIAVIISLPLLPARGQFSPQIAQAERNVDETLSAETHVRKRQGSDLVLILKERVFGPIARGSAVTITLRKPRLFENSFLGDEDVRADTLRSLDHYQTDSVKMQLDTELRNCGRICAKDALVFSARADLKQNFLKELGNILNEIGSTNSVNERVGPGLEAARKYMSEMNIKLFVSSAPKDRESPLPNYRAFKTWVINTSYRFDFYSSGSGVPKLEIFDKAGLLIEQQSARPNLSGGMDSRIFGPVTFRDPINGVLPRGVLADQGNIAAIFSGVEFLWVANLGQEVDNVGKFRVSFE